MSRKLYRIDRDMGEILWSEEKDPLLDEVERAIRFGVLVENSNIDPALLLESDDDCSAVRGGSFCVRPEGHVGMHMRVAYWIGDTNEDS